jgi:hypothetical protein
MVSFSAIAQEVNIDMRYNILRSEPSMNYINWSIVGNRVNKRINDSHDAVTGASVAQTTKEFDAVRYDSMTTRKYTMPVGIRHLLLFPLPARQYTDNFNLTVREEGERLVILFIVSGTAYKIQTDSQKKININNDCFLAKDLTISNTLSSPIKQRFVKAGSDPSKTSSLDWDKIQFVPDTAASDASRKYSGILTAAYNNGVLSIKGVLTPTANKGNE